jgi:hypothetical protein
MKADIKKMVAINVVNVALLDSSFVAPNVTPRER